MSDPQTRPAGSSRSHVPAAPATPPIVMASLFTSAGEIDPGSYAYGRNGNPTWEALEEVLGSLEQADALVFASGQAATLALFLALSEERRRVVLPSDGYYNARALAGLLGPRLEAVEIDLADVEAVARELDGPAVLWAESPTNPLLRVFDLQELAAVAGRAGAPLVVDNTTATAVLQRPLDLGATACVYSLTKATSGHSDIVLGAVTTRDRELIERLRGWRTTAGLIAGPFESWLALRGMRTLALRIERQSATALLIARWLGGLAAVRQVHYPGLDAPSGALVERQMPRGRGPLLSFEVEGGAARADAIIGASRLVRPATSFGGVESTWERRARWAGETAPEGLIRLSVGIEEPDDLLADIGQALEPS